MADDFADKFKSPVVHVKWWGSYLNNFTTPNIPVNKFLISFESDVPDPNPTNPEDFSHPGEPLLNRRSTRWFDARLRNVHGKRDQLRRSSAE